MKNIFKILLIISIIPINIKAEEISNENVIEVYLEKCIDGDTAHFKNMQGEIIPVRFLAIDTPETQHPTKGEEKYGKEASEYTCDVLTNANKIVLELDEKVKEEDAYGRTLAWVFVDDVLVEQLLIEKGYAQVAYLYDDYKYTKDLKEKEKIAKLSKIGIWEEEKEEIKDEIKEELDNIINKIFSWIGKIINEIIEFISSLIDKILK